MGGGGGEDKQEKCGIAVKTLENSFLQMSWVTQTKTLRVGVFYPHGVVWFYSAHFMYS
jgi:hypothetical protein